MDSVADGSFEPRAALAMTDADWSTANTPAPRYAFTTRNRLVSRSPDQEPEEPKPQDPKSQEPKPQELKAQEPKPQELKAQEPKAQEPKAQDPKIKMVRTKSQTSQHEDEHDEHVASQEPTPRATNPARPVQIHFMESSPSTSAGPRQEPIVEALW
ncbi:protein TonB-like [Maniola hyperantus]|uniref:protein TonB-like n=1 Tax=Aphantopus hyperantus TaxID=2795564 RepID=UPI003749E4A4